MLKKILEEDNPGRHFFCRFSQLKSILSNVRSELIQCLADSPWFVGVVSKNTNELKTRAPGRFGLEVIGLVGQWKLKSSVMRTPIQPLTWLVVVIAGRVVVPSIYSSASSWASCAKTRPF